MALTLFSRYGGKSIFTLSSDKTRFTLKEGRVSQILGSTREIQALDFDGGPFIALGSVLDFSNESYQVKRIAEREGQWTLFVEKLMTK